MSDFPRKAQFPALFSCAAAPAVALFMLAARPEAALAALLVPALCAPLAALCLLVPGRLRLPAGALCALALLLFGAHALDALSRPVLLAGPTACAAMLLATLPVAAWPREREPDPRLIIAGGAAHALAQLAVNIARRNGAQAEWLRAAPALLAFFWAFLLLSMLSLSRAALTDANWGRQRAPFATRARLALLTVGLWALTLLLSSWRPLVAAARRALSLLLRAAVALARALLSLLPEPQTGTAPGAGGPPEFALIAEANEPGPLTALLERILTALSLIAGVALAALVCWKLLRAAVRLVRMLLGRLERFAAAAGEDYVDEVSDTRETGERSAALPRLRRRLANAGDASPRARIRRRYARLRAKHGWREASTARETLPPPAAALYERARYSAHEVSAADAERFERESRAPR